MAVPLASRTPPPAASSGSQRPCSVGREGTAGSLRACQAPGRLVWAYSVRPVPGSTYDQLCPMTICAPVHLRTCAMPQCTCTTAHLCSSTHTPANLCSCKSPHLCPSPPAHMHLYSPAPLLPVYVLPTCTHAHLYPCSPAPLLPVCALFTCTPAHLLSAHMCLSTGTPANLLPCLYAHLCPSPHAYPYSPVPHLLVCPAHLHHCPPVPQPTCSLPTYAHPPVPMLTWTPPTCAPAYRPTWASAHMLPAHIYAPVFNHLCPCLHVSLPTYVYLPAFAHLHPCPLASLLTCTPAYLYSCVRSE